MDLYWCSDWDMKGNGYGYSNHTRQMRKWLEHIGVNMTEDADTAVHIIVPTGFQPVHNKFNVLFTMYEADELPPEWIGPLKLADLIVVPCEHNKHLFKRYIKDIPIEVCPEGVDTDKFKFYQRTPPKSKQWAEIIRGYKQKGYSSGWINKKVFDLSLEDKDLRPFTFLWVGASNPRKGYEHIVYAWRKFNLSYPEYAEQCKLIMKTTQVERAERLIQADNVYIDVRDYSLDNLINLYNYSHAFLFPTMGEGWGLTLHEAQATGIPCLYTDFSGPRDFMPRKYAYPLKYKKKVIKTLKTTQEGKKIPYNQAPAASVDVNYLARKMAHVMEIYETALKNGKLASDYVRKMDWLSAAKAFKKIIEKHRGKNNAG